MIRLFCPQKYIRLFCSFAGWLVLASASVLYAGGGPSGYLVVYDVDDAAAVTIANHYQKTRGIPERNMVPYNFNGSFTKTSAWTYINTLRAEIVARGLAGQFQGIAMVGSIGVPLNGGQTSGQGNIFSIHSFTYCSPNYDSSTFPTGIIGNRAYRWYPGEDVTALTPQTQEGGHTFWPTTFLGHVGKNGNSIREVMDYIDRAKARDGAKPDGTVYWAVSSDWARTSPRRPQIAEVMPIWDRLGIRSTVVYMGWVGGRPDIAGGIVGEVSPNVDAQTNTYLPGAWVDHLTSYGGNLNSFSSGGQLGISRWIRGGADGSAGTMSEPYNTPGKFPHGHIHTYFRLGCTLAEAYWQSINTLAESVALGDPLLQPYADIPSILISSPADTATVSGTVAIEVSASATGGKALEPNLDLFIDGRRIAIGQAGEPVGAMRTPGGFTLNSATLEDGRHEVRVAAYNADAIRSQGETAISIVTDNNGRSVQLSGPASVNPDLPLALNVAPSDGADLSSIELRMNGRVLASLPPEGGPVDLDGKLFPRAGVCNLYAIGKRANGGEIWSRPLVLTVQWPAQPGLASPALGSGYAKVRYFSDTTAAGFSWDTASPTAMATYAGSATNGFDLSASAIPGITISAYATKPGYEVSFLFYAPAEDTYEFGWDITDVTVSEFQINGNSVTPVSSPVRLAPGWHRMRMRATFAKSTWKWKMWQRGGYSHDYALIPKSRVVAEDAEVAGSAPLISSVTASTSVVAGTTVQLSAIATNPIGASSALIYEWSKAAGPGSPTFSANATNAARNTTVTFKQAGAYTFGVRVTNGTASAYQTVSLTVSSTPTNVKIWGTDLYNSHELATGEPLYLSASLINQFSHAIASQPAITWTTTSPDGTIIPLNASGRTARFVAGNATGKANITARSGSLSATLPNGVIVYPNTPPQIAALTVSRPDPAGPVILSVTGADTEDPDNIFLRYQWSVDSAPPGQSMALDFDYYVTAHGYPTGPGSYVIRAKVSDGAGNIAENTISFSVAADGTIVSGQLPCVRVHPADLSLQVGNSSYLTVYVVPGVTGHTYQWQISLDGGNNWQDLPGQNTPSCPVGPAGTPDNGKKYRVRIVNSYGTVISKVATLTVDAPTAGTFRFGQSILDAFESDGQAVFSVRRTGGAIGAVTVKYMIYPYAPAVTGSDFGAPAGAAIIPPGSSGAATVEGTLSWAAGDSEDKQVAIPLIADGVPERMENVSIFLTSPTGGATVSALESELYFYIWDSDSGVIAPSQPAYTVREDQGAATVTLRRTGGVLGGVTVTYKIEAPFGMTDSAQAGADYTAVSGSVAWASGETADKQIVVPILRDSEYEGTETVTVKLNIPTASEGGALDLYYVPINILDEPVQTWREAWWPGETNEALIGDSADPDGDGVINLLEYGLGMNPLETSQAGLPVVDAGDDRLQITFCRMKLAEDLIYRVQAADEIGEWTDIWNSSTVPYGGGEAESEELVVEDVKTFLELSGGKRFLRLKLSR